MTSEACGVPQLGLALVLARSRGGVAARDGREGSPAVLACSVADLVRSCVGAAVVRVW